MTIDQLKTAKNFYLVGIKGVGMTSLAQCLLDMGKSVCGSDTKEIFVTQPILDRLAIKIDIGFDHSLPKITQVVIFTVAHSGRNNPLVKEAIRRGLPIFSHAQALAWIFNQKIGIAVCGVGGKTTVSAMIAWSGLQTGLDLSFSVGVGEIVGLKQTGAFSQTSQFFVAEADEYAANPDKVTLGEELIPRFSYLEPLVIVCTNLCFDHPDVYQNLNQTKKVFLAFFQKLKKSGTLIYNQDDQNLVALKNQLAKLRPDLKLLGFGQAKEAQLSLQNLNSNEGLNQAELKMSKQSFTLKLSIPGSYNLMNAAAAAAALSTIGLPIDQSLEALANFQSTGRRLQLIKKTQTAVFYDDYAHHPSEIKAAITALKSWYPEKKLVAIFQPHTVSRTKALINQFATAFDQADQVVLLPIFTSAREKIDQNFSSKNLLEAVQKHNPQLQLALEENLQSIAKHLNQSTNQKVIVTLGAGDVYKAHFMLLETLQVQFPKFNFVAHESLAKHTPVGIGGPAEVFWSAKKTSDLIAVLEFCRQRNIDYTVIGWGANTLFADQGIQGLVIKNQTKEICLDQDSNQTNSDQTNSKQPTENITTRWQPLKKLPASQKANKQSQYKTISVAAGAPLPWVINYLLDKNLVGLENFARIPATVGGAVYNNIHGNQYFFSAFVNQVKVFNPPTGIRILQPQDIDFGYDYSRFHQTHEIILTVTLKLNLGDKKQAKKTVLDITNQKAHQPTRSLGCVWKNLSQIQKNKLKLPTASVGYILEKKLHLSGLKIGDVQVSKKHAAFIENLGKATAQDYLALMIKITKVAQNQLGLRLEPEIFFKGFTKAQLAGLNLKRDNKHTYL